MVAGSPKHQNRRFKNPVSTENHLSAPCANRSKKTTAPRNGILGRAAFQHRSCPRPSLGRGRRTQRHLLNFSLDSRRAFFLRPHRARNHRTFHALSRRGRPLRLVEGSVSANFTASWPAGHTGSTRFFIFPACFSPALRWAHTSAVRAMDISRRTNFLICGSFAAACVAVVMNIIGLNIGKWLQNAGGVGTYVPLLMLVGADVSCGIVRARSRISLCQT